MRELLRPPEITGDDEATEMIRVWLAHGDQHVSLLLGMWQDADDSELDEREAWGDLLADTIRHIAHGLSQSHGWQPAETIRRISLSLTENLRTDAVGAVTGGYVGAAGD